MKVDAVGDARLARHARPGDSTLRRQHVLRERARAEGTVLVLDAGTGIRRLGATIDASRAPRIDLLLTHLHMDHIQGLGFFAPLYRPDCESTSGGRPAAASACASGSCATCRPRCSR